MSSKLKFLLILIGLFFAQFFFISPRGEFALNDDWVHAEMSQHWAETGIFRLNPYTGPMLHFLVAYGAGITKIFGFSFFALRLSTLALTLGLVAIFYLLIFHLTKNSKLSFLTTLALWLNPLVYNLSFSFMTDVPALFFLVAGLFCATLAYEKNNSYWFFLAAFLSVLGFFIRQTNILLLPAIGLPILLHKNYRSWKNIFALTIPSILWAAVYYSLRHANLLPMSGGTFHQIVGGKTAFLSHIFWWFYYTLIYLGLFTLPITLTKKNLKNKKILTVCLLFLVSCLLLFLHDHELFPYVPNLINHFGLGPMNDVLQGNFVPLFRVRAWFIITVIAAIGTGLLLASIKKVKPEHYFLYIFVILFAIPLLGLTGFDRYFLPLIAVFLILLAIAFKDALLRYWPSYIILLMFGLYSVSQTQFYLNWNQTRWEMADLAVKSYHLKTNQVDAGYEWDGWYDYWPAQTAKIPRAPIGSPWWVKFLMTNNTLEYVVSASPLPGYAIVDHRIVPGWNPNRNLYLLKK